MSSDDVKYLLIPMSIIMFFGGFLRLYGISTQPPLSDEVGVAFSAVHYMQNGQFGPTMWYHPNLRNIVTYIIGDVFGYGPYALRGMSLLMGILSIAVLFLLSKVLFKDRLISLLSAFFLSFEQVHITFSRQAIQETWTTFFFLTGVLLFVLYFKKDKPYLLILSGIVFGLGISSKFHALFPLFVCLVSGIYLSYKERSISRCLFVIACLTLIPAIIYLLTYIPWFSRGYGIMEWIQMQKVLFYKMMTHKGNPMDQVIDTQAWQWFLRPMGYANFVHFGGKPFVTIAFSNPFVWLFVLPSTLFIVMKVIRKKYPVDEINSITFIIALFIASYLPLAISTRPIWLLSSLATIPFAFIIIAKILSEFMRSFIRGKTALIGYLAIVVLSSLLLYPMAIGKAKDYDYLGIIVERFRPPFERDINP